MELEPLWKRNPTGSGNRGVLLELIIRVDKLELIRKKGQKKGGWLSPPPRSDYPRSEMLQIMMGVRIMVPSGGS